MRSSAAFGVLFVLVLGSASNALARPAKPSRLHPVGHVQFAKTAFQRATGRLAQAAVFPAQAARSAGPATPKVVLSELEVDIVARINAQRGSRGLRTLCVSRGLTAAAKYHSQQMGLFGFFEHESRNGAPFWQRIERFYPSGRGYWSIGENILFESPETTGSSAMQEWMQSPLHRQNILTGEWREVGVAAVHFTTGRGAFGGREVTIVTTDFGVRR